MIFRQNIKPITIFLLLTFISQPTLNSMQIFIKTLTGKTLTLEVKSTDTIESVKKRLYTAGENNVNLGKFIFQGKQLDLYPEKNTLQDFGIKKESTLHIVYPFTSGSIEKPRIKTIDGKYLNLGFHWEVKVEKLKEWIELTTSIKPVNQLLIYENKALNNKENILKGKTNSNIIKLIEAPNPQNPPLWITIQNTKLVPYGLLSVSRKQITDFIISKNMSIKDLKIMIYNKWGYLPEYFHLMHESKTLEDHLTLKQVNLKQATTLIMRKPDSFPQSNVKLKLEGYHLLKNIIVDKKNTILDLKKMLLIDKFRIPPKYQVLKLSDKILTNKSTVEQEGLTTGNTISLEYNFPSPKQKNIDLGEKLALTVIRGNKSLELNTYKNRTVLEIKKGLYKHKWMEKSNDVLIGKPPQKEILKNNDTLQKYGLKDHDTITIASEFTLQPVNISVDLPNGKLGQYKIGAHYTVTELKQLFEIEIGLPASWQILYIKKTNEKLQNDRKIKEYFTEKERLFLEIEPPKETPLQQGAEKTDLPQGLTKTLDSLNKKLKQLQIALAKL